MSLGNLTPLGRTPLRDLRLMLAPALLTVLALAALMVIPQRLAAEGSEKESKCTLTTGKWADPSELWLGEYTWLTLTTTTKCPSTLIPLHVVLSLDASLSMRPNNKLQDAQDAARRFVSKMDFEISKVGVTSFSDQAYVNCELTDQRGRAVSAINNLELKFGTDVEGGLNYSREVIVRGRLRNPDPDLPAPTEIIIMLSDGLPYPRNQNPLAAAGRIKAQKILISTVCVGADCDQSLMRSIASRPDLFFDVRDSGKLLRVYDQLADQFLDTQLRTMSIVDELPDNMRYVTDSANPPPDEVSSDSLKWTMDVIPSAGVTVTYQIEPLEAGIWPTNRQAFGDFRDNNDGIGHMVFPTPTVKVKVPPTPTPTLTPVPTPTNTPAPPTDTPTPTLTPTATPTPVPVPIYLPVLLTEQCDPEVVSIDVVLAIDVSSSMKYPTRAGGLTKREAARLAARAFVRQLRPGADQVAIVLFSDQAQVLLDLTDAPAEALQALDTLPEHMGTRIDAGIETALGVLKGKLRDPASDPAILLVTDGCPTRSSAAVVRAAARKVHDEGIPLFTVGLGADVNSTLLASLAGRPDRYYSAPEAEDLLRIYRALAPVIACPSGRHDWSQTWP